MQQNIDNETKQTCTRCLKAKPTSDYGKHKAWAFIEESNDAQEVVLPYASCKGCRDQDNIYNKQHRDTITQYNDTSQSSIKPVVKIDVNHVVNLLTNYSTNKLNKLMLTTSTNHIFAYAETNLKIK